MKAYIRKSYGGPEVYHLSEVAIPKPQASEILIKVYATSVNRTDDGFLRGKPWIVRPLGGGVFKMRQPSLGCEFAGEVVEIGADVHRFKKGDRVFGFNDTRFGGHAEYSVICENSGVAHIPDGISYETAAVFSEGAHYALCDLRAAKVGPGIRILILGGTGAIGSAAIQLARALGAEVAAVCAESHFARVRSLGVDEVYDYVSTDFAQEIRNTQRERFDVVFDAVGKSTFKHCKPLLKSTGIYMATDLGPWAQNPFLAIFTRWNKKHKVLMPLPYVRHQDLEWIASLAAQGLFKPMIDKVVPFEELAPLFDYVTAGRKIGNVVVSFSQ